jgi:hypothetical protein
VIGAGVGPAGQRGGSSWREFIRAIALLVLGLVHVHVVTEHFRIH